MGTWTTLGETEKITFSQDGSAVVLKEVKGQTEFRGTEVRPGVFEGDVIQDGARGGRFRLEETKAGIEFLPMTLQGKKVLVHEGGNKWRADNSELKSRTQGLVYRRSKRMDDKIADRRVAWGSLVEGTADDGWLKVQPKASDDEVLQEHRSGLKYAINKPGVGAPARKGALIKVRYEGWLGKNGKQFDKGHWKFKVGKGEVTKGWDLGVLGMKTGEVRKLYVPPQLGYGSRGDPP